MSRITVIDNTFNQKLPLPDFYQDCENLRKIANKTIGDLQSESGILIFPPRIEDTDDQIKDSIILTLKESDNFFSMDTGNIMGFIGNNDTELNICSRFTHKIDGKISEKNDFFLHYMLEKVCHINLTNLKSTRSPDKIFDLLPFLFPQYLISALRQGIYKEYQKHEYNNSNVRGIIDVNRHIRFNIPANGKIAYNTREYSFDNPITELVRHTIEYIRSSNTFKHILASSEEVKTAVETIINSTPLYNRMERNKILQKICRMILLHEKIRYYSSSNKIYGLLFDGAWLWEEYLATILKKKGYEHPENKNKKGVIYPFVKSQVGNFYPDFYKPKLDCKLNEKTADIILDAKYKNFDERKPPADDLAQMISYIHVMDARLGEFIYPSKGDNTSGANWIIKPFANATAELKTKPFLIPQDGRTYSEFKAKMKESEKQMFY